MAQQGKAHPEVSYGLDALVWYGMVWYGFHERRSSGSSPYYIRLLFLHRSLLSSVELGICFTIVPSALFPLDGREAFCIIHLTVLSKRVGM